MKIPLDSPDTESIAAASGSEGSSSNVVANTQLTWDKILAELVGSAQAQGIYNVSANMHLAAGNAENGKKMFER